MENSQNIQNDGITTTVGEQTVEGTIIDVRNGEAIVFEVNLGIFKLVAIVNIPPDGEKKAPVYLKMKVPEISFRRAQKDQNKHRNRRTSPDQKRDVA